MRVHPCSCFLGQPEAVVGWGTLLLVVLEPASCTAPLELELESWGPLGHSQSAFSADIHPQLACCSPGLFSPGPTRLFHPAPGVLHLLQRHLLSGCLEQP